MIKTARLSQIAHFEESIMQRNFWKYVIAVSLLTFACGATATTKRSVIVAGSCAGQIGKLRANVLVNQCLMVSPATHPPCNIANSCNEIRSEIARGCGFLNAPGERRPAFCGQNQRR